MLETIRPRWQSCIVAAPGPSLPLAVPFVTGPTIVVQDAWRALPQADVLYGCDNHWWEYYKGTGFRGEKWSTHEHDPREQHVNDKTELAKKYGIKVIHGRDGDTFSLDPSVIHYGSNSGFQAINLAILFGCTYIILVGFDMQSSGGRQHFFGDHPKELGATKDYERFIPRFESAAKALPAQIRIVNATPGSALKCFPMMSLEDAIADRDLRRDGAVLDDESDSECAA